MSSKHARLGGFLASARTRAALSLGVVLAFGSAGTFAHWTDSVTVDGTTFTAGTLNLSLNALDTSYATTTLAMATMVPGSTSAEVIPVKNAGNVPMKYSLTGGLTGTGAAALAPDLKLRIVLNGTTSGVTCAGGSNVIYNSALTAVPATEIIPVATKRPLSAGVTESLCFEVTFAAGAVSTQQGKSSSASFTFTGTSDLS
jgi:predicted ribosomally synthesized peptide with SipW-like signal peptide